MHAQDAVSLADNAFILSRVERGGVGKGGNIVEAQGWIVSGKGDIMLVAQSGQSSSIPSVMSCSQ
ncbi:hypothetical protein [Nostoc sp.]|uniref:hypothetical protein n=1 Tax=Nostoc sp. TaxID=1180 RepID=UPI002FF5544D